MDTKAKRVSLSIEKKVEILKEVEIGVLGKADIARKYGLSSSTLSTILKCKDRIMEANKNGCAPNRKRSREAKFPALENALIAWMKKCRGRNVSIDGNLLKAKAEDFALRMNIDHDFRASDGWIQRFKLRHGLVFKKLCGESASVNPENVKNWKEGRLLDLLKQYKPEDIYNADETGLFFRLLPDKSFVFKKDESGHGSKKPKVRITLLLAANMAGTDKLPLLVIGKSRKPRCFKGVKTLPNACTYRANAKSWMTAEFFEEWVRALDRKMKLQRRKVVLIIDNCTAHPQITGLEAIQLEFFPPNATSILQPLDQGIIQSFKLNYKRMLLKRMILCLENDKEYQIDILGAIHLSNEAWKQVSQSTIVNCFRHAGFACTEASRPTSDDSADRPIGGLLSDITNEDVNVFDDLQERLNIGEKITFAEFLNADADVQCTEDVSEEEIIAEAMKPPQPAELAASSDDEDCSSSKKTASFKEALEALETLKVFFRNSKTSGHKHVQLLNDIECEVFDCDPPKKQTRITDYLQ